MEAFKFLVFNTIENFHDKIFQILIDDSVFKNVNWVGTWKNKRLNIGITTFIDISQLKNGLHKISITGNPNLIFEQKNQSISIPFYVNK